MPVKAGGRTESSPSKSTWDPVVVPNQGVDQSEKYGKVVANYFGINYADVRTRFYNDDKNDGYALLQIEYERCTSRFYLRSDGLIPMNTTCGGNNPTKLFGDPKKMKPKVLAVLEATNEYGVKGDAKEVAALKAKLK